MTQSSGPAGSDVARTIVRELLSGQRPAREVERFNRIREQDLRQDIRLKRFYGYFLPIAMTTQLLLADAGFFLYAWWGVRWKIVPSIMHVWLGATVVEVIGVVVVVTRYLFPRRDAIA